MATSFRSFFDERKCEGCNEGVMVRGGDWDEQVLDCPDPCPRRKDVEYVYEQFNNWLDNIETKLSDDDYKNMAAAMDKKQQDRGYEYFWLKDLSMFNDTAEAFNYWVDANKSIFTADDYDTMADAI